MEPSGKIVSLQISTASRTPMKALDSARAIEDYGLEGDRHAHSGGKRQVLLMDQETLTEFGLAAGMVKENITTQGIDFRSLTPGTRLRVGDAVLEVTVSCEPCGRMDQIRPGLREALEGQRGMLARVVGGGTLRVGDPIEIVR